MDQQPLLAATSSSVQYDATMRYGEATERQAPTAPITPQMVNGSVQLTLNFGMPQGMTGNYQVAPTYQVANGYPAMQGRILDHGDRRPLHRAFSILLYFFAACSLTVSLTFIVSIFTAPTASGIALISVLIGAFAVYAIALCCAIYYISPKTVIFWMIAEWIICTFLLIMTPIYGTVYPFRTYYRDVDIVGLIHMSLLLAFHLVLAVTFTVMFSKKRFNWLPIRCGECTYVEKHERCCGC